MADLLIGLAIIAVVAFLGYAMVYAKPPVVKAGRRPPAPPENDFQSDARELTQLELLAKYGTPADAQRLADAGHDLAASGWQDPR